MKQTRRNFIKKSSAFTAPLIVAPSVLGLGESVAPNARINLACIGVGGQGTGNMRAFLQDERVQVVAVCDVDRRHRERAMQAAKLKPADTYNDYRKVIARKDIDAVMIATPDHWHSLITVGAARSGKDIFCEKPLAASIGEGRIVSDLVRKEKRVLQCGTWRRSRVHSRMACEWVRNGYIGELKKVEVGVPGKFAIRGGFTGLEGTQPVPEGFDYAMWTGSAPEAPYTAARCHFNFRWVNDYAPGYITDWGAHFIDVAHWGMNADDTNPVEISATDVSKREKGIYDAAEGFKIRYRYANGVEMTMFSTTDGATYGTKFIGTEGSVFVENQKLITDPPSLRKQKLKDSDTPLYASTHHHRNFIDCILSRARTASTVESAHRAGSACHLGAIAADLGRPLKFDPVKETFIDDAEANARVTRTFHGSWTLG
ncbi:MAG: putative dehydrogenase [Candidatus Omnitrophota bacterium]|jgi:predicted dehydrogenase